MCMPCGMDKVCVECGHYGYDTHHDEEYCEKHRLIDPSGSCDDWVCSNIAHSERVSERNKKLQEELDHAKQLCEAYRLLHVETESRIATAEEDDSPWHKNLYATAQQLWIKAKWLSKKKRRRFTIDFCPRFGAGWSIEGEKMSGIPGTFRSALRCIIDKLEKIKE